MAGSNDFLPFAAAGGANVISQAAYAAMAALGPGFTAGIAQSNQLNKVWRQSSIMSAVLAQLMADVSGQNSTDDGTTANLLTNLITTLTAANYSTDIGATNSYQVNLTPATEVIDGTAIRFRAANTNTGASTFSVNGSPAHGIVAMDGNALTGGEIHATGYATIIWDALSSVWILQGCSAGYGKSMTPPANDNSTKIATTAFVFSASSVSGSGYIKFGNGVIIQWQTVNGSSSSGSFSFPLAFPTACFAIFGTTQSVGYVSLQPTSTTAASWNLGGTSAAIFYAFSIGH
jgi:hypothetical protein